MPNIFSSTHSTATTPQSHTPSSQPEKQHVDLVSCPHFKSARNSSNDLSKVPCPTREAEVPRSCLKRFHEFLFRVSSQREEQIGERRPRSAANAQIWSHERAHDASVLFTKWSILFQKKTATLHRTESHQPFRVIDSEDPLRMMNQTKENTSKVWPQAWQTGAHALPEKTVRARSPR